MKSIFDFSEIGLEIRDRRVYEALVASPHSSLRKIAADTGINRGSVYESVKNLAEKGLVGSIEVGKQRRYTATDPSAILEIIRDKRDSLKKSEKEAAEYIQSLTVEPKSDAETPFASFYEDHEGVPAILRDVIATCRNGRNGSAYRVISTKKVSQFMYHNFRNFTQKRIAEGISVRVIGVENQGSNSVNKLAERRVMKATRGEAPNCYTIIYGTKVAYITLSEQNVLAATVMDHLGISQLQKELFDHLWNGLYSQSK